MTSIQDQLDKAKAFRQSNPEQCISQLREIVLSKKAVDSKTQKIKEEALETLCDVYVDQSKALELKNILNDLREVFAGLPKAKTARLVRSVIDKLAKIPNSMAIQLEVCQEQQEWARKEKRTFLRQRIELRLSNLYLQTKQYTSALKLIGTLLSEVKKLDDKLLLVDIHLLESKVHHALRNQPKAKAGLTAARAAANAIYIPPSLQAEIDLQSGVLNAEEHDYQTAYSYFFEAFEAQSALESPKSTMCMKYMLLCKIMNKAAGEVPAVVSAKLGSKPILPPVQAMLDLAAAHTDRSLQKFQACLSNYGNELQQDPVVAAHLDRLYQGLMATNLQRIIEPYSRVEVEKVAELIQLPVSDVETKLSQMIIDKQLAGTLDQGNGCVELFQQEQEDDVYNTTLQIYDSVGRVVDTLFQRSQKIVA